MGKRLWNFSKMKVQQDILLKRRFVRNSNAKRLQEANWRRFKMFDLVKLKV